MVSTPQNGDVSFWYADIGGRPNYRAPLPGNTQADVCIVGAGYTGLWTAYYLKKAQPNLNIILVDKEFAGYGASGRNGGWLSGGFGWSRTKYAAQSSKEAVIRLERLIKGTVDEVIRIAEMEGIEADIQRTSNLDVACSPAQMVRLQAEFQHQKEWGVPTDEIEILDARQSQQRIHIPSAVGGLLTHNVARVQPAKLVQGLAKVVERLGVTIYEQTAALSIQKGVVHTARGSVHAPFIVRATEGFSASIKNYRRQWIPLNSAMIVTEPLSDALWQSIGWEQYELLGDAAHCYCYGQRTRGNRIALGGRGVPYRFGSQTDQDGRTQEATIAQLKTILLRLFPQLHSVAIEHAWCGVLGVPRDWCATVGLDPHTGIAWAGGYVGLGVSTSNLSGRTLADLILGKNTEITQLPWVNRSVKNWEPEPLRWLAVHGMYQLYHHADRSEMHNGGQKTSSLAKFANFLTGR